MEWEGHPTPVFLSDNPKGKGAWAARVHEIAKSWTQMSMHGRTYDCNNQYGFTLPYTQSSEKIFAKMFSSSDS